MAATPAQAPVSAETKVQGCSYAPPQLALFDGEEPEVTYRLRDIEHGPLRRCGGCNRMLPFFSFSPAPAGRDGRSNSCPDCTLRNARVARGVARDVAHLRPTPDDRCAICTGDGGERGLFLDHDHATGAFRGWLCHPCNSGIGALQDDPELLAAAIRYLEASGQ